MSGKGFNFFEKLTEQMAICKKAAQQLIDMLEDYSDVSVKAEMIHVSEHEGDTMLHDIMGELNRSFITPIDREDIADLAKKLDDINDSIEDVANLFDMLSITSVREEAKTMARFILSACETLYDVISEFYSFKNSKKLKQLIIKVNGVEEDGDRMHRSVIKNMFQKETDVLSIIKWKEIFDMMESVLDNCEDAADLVDSLIMKNT